MKTKRRQARFVKMISLIFLLWFINPSNGQTFLPIKKFEITVVSYNLPGPSLEKFILKNNELSILKKYDPGKDSVLFAIKLIPTDTLKLISEFSLNKFERYYSNNCIDDGLRISVVLKIDNVIKSVLLDNYYQQDIGTIINFINSLVPTRYRIWYDKERLIKDYKNCKSNN